MPASGPVTPAGKAVASRNAVRHGLYTSVIVASAWEAEDDWCRFHDATVGSLTPEGALEVALASRAAALLWRLRRVPAAEADLIDRTAERAGRAAARMELLAAEAPDSAGPRDFYARVPASPVARALPDESSFAPLIRMEAHLNRQLLHTLHELEALQERRRGNGAPLARVDVHGLPGT